jgi:hypothetical protein
MVRGKNSLVYATEIQDSVNYMGSFLGPPALVPRMLVLSVDLVV